MNCVALTHITLVWNTGVWYWLWLKIFLSVEKQSISTQCIQYWCVLCSDKHWWGRCDECVTNGQSQDYLGAGQGENECNYWSLALDQGTICDSLSQLVVTASLQRKQEDTFRRINYFTLFFPFQSPSPGWAHLRRGLGGRLDPIHTN